MKQFGVSRSLRSLRTCPLLVLPLHPLSLRRPRPTLDARSLRSCTEPVHPAALTEGRDLTPSPRQARPHTRDQSSPGSRPGRDGAVTRGRPGKPHIARPPTSCVLWLRKSRPALKPRLPLQAAQKRWRSSHPGWAFLLLTEDAILRSSSVFPPSHVPGGPQHPGTARRAGNSSEDQLCGACAVPAPRRRRIGPRLSWCSGLRRRRDEGLPAHP